MPLAQGFRLDSYDIIAPLGAGGMGEVYRARDTVLKRDVAIKVLPSYLSRDPDRLRRFEIEAQAAAALNHPNIVSIFHVGWCDGSPYIVTELLHGETLRERLRHGPLQVHEVLDKGIEFARGLSAAHEAGIVHRDLKPENLFITKDGRIKILDFGLAKLDREKPVGDGTTTLSQPTTPGQVLGTVGYMAPEQVCGEVADARSDIFAVGVILYEMLTGKRPFQRATSAETMTAILKEDPPSLSQAGVSVPPGLQRIVNRCLSKAQMQRFHHASDLAFAIETLSDASTEVYPVASGTADSGKKWIWTRIAAGTSRRLVWAGVAGLAIIVGGAIWYQRSRPSRPVLQPTESLLFSAPGFLAQPNLSPDGNQVAFSWDGGTNGYTQIYLKVVGSGEPLRLTNGDANALSPVWSRDGAAIAYTISNGDNRAILPGARVVGVRLNHVVVISALGGAARDVFSYEGELTKISWSADGRALFIPDGNAVYIVSVSDREKRKILDAPMNRVYISSILSPDGHTLALIDTPEQTPAPSRVYLQNVGTDGTPQGALHQLPISQRLVYSMSWSADSKALVFSGATYLEAANLWRFTIDGKHESRLENIGTGGASPSIVGPSEGHSGRMVYWHIFDEKDIWKVSREKGKPLQTTPLIASSYREWDPRYSPDGTKIAFSSDRGGGSDIWVSTNNGTEQTLITNMNGKGTSGARWSPDGRQIAFLTMKDGQSEIYTIDARGGTPVRITNNPAHDTAPMWSPDGRWIYFASNRTGRFELWRAASDGKGDAAQVTQNGGYSMIFAPDGKAMYYTKWNLVEGIWKQELVDGMPSGEESRIVPIPLTNWGNFDVNREGIAYVPVESAPTHIYFRRFSDGATTKIGEILGTPDFGISLSPVDGSVLFSQVNKPRREIVLVENFQ